MYDNLLIKEAQKEDPDQLLDAFEKYFKPESNNSNHGMDGKCNLVHIIMRQNSVPIQKPPGRVPLVKREKFKKELDSMEAQSISSKFNGRDISPEWLNSFVIVKKPNASLRICLDPTDLNKEIVRPVCNS